MRCKDLDTSKKTFSFQQRFCKICILFVNSKEEKIPCNILAKIISLFFMVVITYNEIENKTRRLPQLMSTLYHSFQFYDQFCKKKVCL